MHERKTTILSAGTGILTSFPLQTFFCKPNLLYSFLPTKILQKSKAPSKNEHMDHKGSAGVTTGIIVSISPKVRNRIRDKDKKVLVS